MKDGDEIKKGMHVKIGRLGTTDGMLINQRHLTCRRTGITGVIDGWVPGHGCDVWWVRHDRSLDIGAYCFTEFMQVNPRKVDFTAMLKKKLTIRALFQWIARNHNILKVLK
jgi:hypothetical protein